MLINGWSQKIGMSIDVLICGLFDASFDIWDVDILRDVRFFIFGPPTTRVPPGVGWCRGRNRNGPGGEDSLN